MHISLTPELESIVKSKVDSGLYNNASEVIRETLRKMCNDDEVAKVKLAALRESLFAGAAQADRGDFVECSIDSIISELDEEEI